MEQQVFFIVSSLGAGGSERVYWLLSQYFCSKGYAVSVIYLNANDTCFSTNTPGINFIDLKTIRASKSFVKLYKLIKKEKPIAVYSTTDHLNLLTGLVACLLKIPHLIARASNDPIAMKEFYGLRARFYNLFTRLIFLRFDKVVCQTDEMATAITSLYNTDKKKMTVIPNPAPNSRLIKLQSPMGKTVNLVTVGRLSKEKGHFRLLDTLSILPKNYSLTIIGTGKMMEILKKYTVAKKLETRVTFRGHSDDVLQELLAYDLMVMTSFTEGFPNAILESLSIGLPVVTFAVSGSKELIKDSFNGFIVAQGNIVALSQKIIQAHNFPWEHEQIKADACNRFNLQHIGLAYENLLHL